MFSASKTAGPSGYNINNSLRFRASASANLSRTPSSSTNRNTWTVSLWAKRSNIGGWGVLLNSGTTTNFEYFTFRSDDTLQWVTYSGAILGNLITTQVFRDPSAWYHIVFAFDSTQATSSNRLKLYINGSQVTAFGTATYPSLNYNSYINLNQIHNIGRDGFGDYFDGYMAEYNFIDGQALTPSSFGSTNTTTGVWQPAKYTGSYGTNGFYLPFSDIGLTSGSNTGLGKDFSGNSNYWTTNNISVTAGTTYDAMTDSPTNTSATVANYATLNPLMAGTPFQTNAAATVSQGNLQADWGTTSAGSLLSTIAMTSGKWYFEGTVTGTNTREVIGIVNSSAATTTYAGGDANGWGYFSVNGNKYNNGSATSYGATYTTNDIIGVAFDADAGSLTFYKNGTSQGTAFTGLASGTYFFAVSDANASLACGWNVNFGQRPFSYTPPTGFNRLNTFNLPNSTIVKGNSYMDATLYTGNGTSQTITTAASFKPDLVWIKGRSYADFHTWFDTVRGATKSISSDLTTAEVTRGTALTAFTSTGFTVGSDTLVNYNGQTTVAWQWQAGQGSTSSNTAGSITSTTSVSTTAGFSIVSYTEPASGSYTVGHGLGVAPKMIILRERPVVTNWLVWHNYWTPPTTRGLYLNSTSAAFTTGSNWLNSVTSSVFGITVGQVTGGGSTTIAYCFAEIAGFSKFGSYTGNGSTDGPFVYTGFRPKWIMIKRTDTTADWQIIDTPRQLYNDGAVANQLRPNSSVAEASAGTYSIDILSNGFKDRTGASTNWNTNGGTYIYAAFAENPFKNALAR
jgi:hypothetical protein